MCLATFAGFEVWCSNENLTSMLPVTKCYVTHGLDKRSFNGVQIVKFDIDEHGVGDKEDLRLGGSPVPVAFCLSQLKHELNRSWTWALRLESWI
jgi:hypothetical protein